MATQKNYNVNINAEGRRVGESHPKARLTDEQVEKIREAYDLDTPIREIAERFGVAESTVRGYCNYSRRNCAAAGNKKVPVNETLVVQPCRGGRPSAETASQILAKNYILSQISEGVSLRHILKLQEHPGLPQSRSAVYMWMEKDKDFAAKMAIARDIGADAIAEEALTIADDGRNDFMARLREDGELEYVPDRENVKRSTLRVHTRLQLIKAWNPRYGNKTETTLTGPGGGAVQFTDTERAAKLQAIIANAQQRGANACQSN